MWIVQLRMLFEKIYEATLTEFMTNKVNIDKDKIKKIFNKCNGNKFLNLNANGKTDAQQIPFCVFRNYLSN